MKTLVFTGTRRNIDYVTRDMIHEIIDTLLPDLILVGCAKGVDECVREYVKCDGNPICDLETFYANWGALGSYAGNQRNSDMIARAVDIRDNYGSSVKAFAFPGPNSKGTWDCVHKLVAEGIPVFVNSAKENYK